jgi:L-ascorbate metabolism protein UlaG (beta-lactamase superfamily)
MRISFWGHASLLIESGSSNVLFDPLCGDSLGHGSNVVYPPRKINTAALPVPLILIISHRHNDHCDFESLGELRRLGDPQVLIPDDASLELRLRKLGYTSIRRLHPFDYFQLGELTIMATPSSVNVPELGFVLMDDDGVVWNQVDTHFEKFVPDVLERIGRRVDIVLTPFQSGVYNEFIPLLGDVMDEATVGSLVEKARRRMETLVAAIKLMRPRIVIPFADGLCYPPEVEEMNSLHFVERNETFLRSVKAHLPEVDGIVPYPGLSIKLRRGLVGKDHHVQWLVAEDYSAERLQFKPWVKLDPVIQPLLPLSEGDGTSRLANLLNGVGDCVRAFGEQASAVFVEQGQKISDVTGEAAWYLSVEGADFPYHYRLRWTTGGAAFTEVAAADARTPSLRMHVNDLIGVLENRVDLFDIILGARVRLKLPDGVAITNEMVHDLCVNPAWFALGHRLQGTTLVGRF